MTSRAYWTISAISNLKAFTATRGHDVNYILQLLMDHKKYEDMIKGAKGIKYPQSDIGDKQERHNDRGSSSFTGSRHTRGLHNSNDNPRIKRSPPDTHEDYAKDIHPSATNSDKNLHGDSSNTRSKRSTATATHSRTKGQEPHPHSSDPGSQPISANRRNNMQRQSTADGAIMDMTPRDGSTSGVAPNGVSYKDMQNESRSLFACLECIRHHVYHKPGSEYDHHVEKEEHDTLHEVAHGLHFASVALLGFLVFEVNICI